MKITTTIVIHFDEDDTNVTAWWIPKSTAHLCVPRIGFRNPTNIAPNIVAGLLLVSDTLGQSRVDELGNVLFST